MKVAVTSTVVFEIPDRDGYDLAALAARFRQAHELAIGRPMETLTGQAYTLVALRHLEVKRDAH